MIDVQDITKPILTNVQPNTTARCGETLPLPINPTATDNCDANVAISMVETRLNGVCSGSYRVVRVWTATDNCGNTATISQEITVGDDAPPTLVGVPANITIGCADQIPTPVPVTATDVCDPNVRVSVQDVRSNGICASAFVITRTWTATDACGNTAIARQTITAEDKIAPVFANVPTHVTINCDVNVPIVVAPSVSDNCDPNPRVTFVENRQNGNCVGSYKLIRVWTASDACGNTSTASQQVNIDDNTPPVLVGVPTNITLNCSDNLPTGVSVTATDNCDPNPRVIMSDNMIRGNCVSSYTIIRTWTASDACGNVATGSQTISVGDNTPPVFANVPTNVTANCDQTIPSVIQPTVSDNCDYYCRSQRIRK